MSILAATFAAALASQGAVLMPAQAPEDGVSPALAEKANEIVRQRLTGAGVIFQPLFPDAGATAKAPPKEALAKLRDGKDAYLQLRFDDAEVALADASKELLAALPSSDVFDAFAEAEAYRAATALAEGKTSLAEAALMRVVLRRPAWVADTAIFPPDFASAFRRAKGRAGAVSRPRWEIVSEPPLASVVIDGAVRGRTPLVLTDLPAGRHAVRVFAAGREVFAKDLLVKSDGPRLKVVLTEDPVASLYAKYVEEVQGPAKKKRVRTLLAKLAAARGVDVVYAIALLPNDDKPYTTSISRVTKDKGLRRSSTPIAQTFTDAPDALDGAVARLLDPAGPALSIPKGSAAALDFKTWFFGRALVPEPPREIVAAVARTTSTTTPTVKSSDPPEAEGSALPLLFGGGAAALVGVAVIGAVAGGLAAAYFYDENRGVEEGPYTVKVGGGVNR